jgi:hypothetical protein
LHRSGGYLTWDDRDPGTLLRDLGEVDSEADEDLRGGAAPSFLVDGGVIGDSRRRFLLADGKHRVVSPFFTPAKGLPLTLKPGSQKWVKFSASGNAVAKRPMLSSVITAGLLRTPIGRDHDAVFPLMTPERPDLDHERLVKTRDS